MRVTPTGFDPEWVRHTLDFANLREPSPEQVERLFNGLILVRWADLLDEAVRRPAREDYAGLQMAIRAALDAISRGDSRATREVAQEAQRRLERSTYVPRLARTDKAAYTLGGVFPVFIPPASVEECCWLAVQLLLDEQRGWGRRLGRCGAPDCGRFNLTFEGRPRRHCSDARRRRYDETMAAQRVKAWRDRERKKRERRNRAPTGR